MRAYSSDYQLWFPPMLVKKQTRCIRGNCYVIFMRKQLIICSENSLSRIGVNIIYVVVYTDWDLLALVVVIEWAPYAFIKNLNIQTVLHKSLFSTQGISTIKKNLLLPSLCYRIQSTQPSSPSHLVWWAGKYTATREYVSGREERLWYHWVINTKSRESLCPWLMSQLVWVNGL